MNNVTPYEILIAKKVEQVPLPDMADSIWATIEQQLDAGTPDSGENSTSSTPPGKGLPGASKLLYVLVPAAIIVATFYFTGNKKTQPDKTEQVAPVLPAETAITPQDSGQQESTPLEKSNSPLFLQPDTKTLNNTGTPFIVSGNGVDSFQNIGLPAAQADTTTVKNNNPAIILPDTATISPPQKKPKGVQGIKNSDYKIIASDKDSGKKKN